MTDELVVASENDDELVAILAHEIGHLEHRHSIRMAMQSSAVALIIAAISGDVVSSSSLLVALPTVLIHSSYSQEFETEADDYAWHYLVDNAIPTGSFASILTRIDGASGDSVVSKYLSSHPGTRLRVQRFIQGSAKSNMSRQ
jgi:Zn-dependent protease with chaperone function